MAKATHYDNPHQGSTPCGITKTPARPFGRKGMRRRAVFLSQDMDRVDCKRCIASWNRFAREGEL